MIPCIPLQSGVASDEAENVADSGQVPLHLQFARSFANLGRNALHESRGVSGRMMTMTTESVSWDDDDDDGECQLG